MRIAMCMCALVLTAGLSAVAEVSDPNPPASSPTRNSDISADTAASAATDLDQQLHAALLQQRESERLAMAKLLEELDASIAGEQRDEVQRRIVDAKTAGELARLTIQLDFAQRGGFTDAARRLTAAIDTLTARRDMPSSSHGQQP